MTRVADCFRRASDGSTPMKPARRQRVVIGNLVLISVLAAAACFAVLGLGGQVYAQESGLRSLNTPAPEFPPPVGSNSPSAGGDMAGGPRQTPQGAPQQRPAGTSQQIASTASPQSPEGGQAGTGG